MLVFSKKGVVTNTSILSGKTRTMKTSATAEQIEKWLGGMLIQDAMPNVSVNEREFIKTGITPEEWTNFIGDTHSPEEEI